MRALGKMGLAFGLVLALPTPGWAPPPGAAPQASPPAAAPGKSVVLGRFGAWELTCDNHPDTGCIASADIAIGGNRVTVLVAAIAPRRFGVIVEGRNYVVTGQVDDGPPAAGQCEGDICLFTDLAFEAAWARGRVLTVRVAVPGRQPFAFDCDLPDMRRALAAGIDWLNRNPRN